VISLVSLLFCSLVPTQIKNSLILVCVRQNSLRTVLVIYHVLYNLHWAYNLVIYTLSHALHVIFIVRYSTEYYTYYQAVHANGNRYVNGWTIYFLAYIWWKCIFSYVDDSILVSIVTYLGTIPCISIHLTTAHFLLLSLCV